MLMENKYPESWSSAHIYQSQWLQTTISDLDEKLGAMMTILEGHNSPKQGHIIQMLEEFGQSYRVLAEAYNQLKSKTSQCTFHSGSLSSSTTSKTICASCNCNRRTTGNLEDKKHEERRNCHLKSLAVAEHSGFKFDSTNLDFELLDKQKDVHDEYNEGFPTNEDILMKIEDLELNQRNEDPSMFNSKFESMWSMLKCQMTKLTEDNVQQLVELVQRNDEKRETIRRLQLEVEILKRENKALKNSLRHSNADSECNQTQISRPAGGMSIGKLIFRGCSP